MSWTFTLLIATCIRNKESFKTQTKTQSQLENSDLQSLPNLLKNVIILFTKWGIYWTRLSQGCIQLQHSGTPVKKSQSAQTPTKQTWSYLNQMKWVLIRNAIKLVLHVNSILNKFLRSTIDLYRLAEWLLCMLINTTADVAPLGIKYWSNKETGKASKIRSRLNSKFCQKQELFVYRQKHSIYLMWNYRFSESPGAPASDTGQT